MKYGYFLGVTGASINALGDLHVTTASKTLVLSLYRTPELFTQIRRALVASGPSAMEELRKDLHPSLPYLHRSPHPSLHPLSLHPLSLHPLLVLPYLHPLLVLPSLRPLLVLPSLHPLLVLP